MIASRFQFPNNAGRSSHRADDALDQSVLLGCLVLTDDGRTGRVRRFVPDPENHFSALEVEGLDGATSILSPRDVRFIYPTRGHDSEQQRDRSLAE
jgi:hypothetical protein